MDGSRLMVSRKKVWGWGMLLLLLLCWYGYAYGPASRARELLAGRKGRIGKTAGVFGKIIAVYQDDFLIKFDSRVIRIKGRMNPDSLYKNASVTFELTEDREFRLVDRMVFYLRNGRINVSVVCLLLFSVLFFRRYRLRFSPFGFIGK